MVHPFISISSQQSRRRRYRPVLLSTVFHAVLLGLVIAPNRPVRYSTVPRGTIEAVHYMTLALPADPGRARAPRRAIRVPKKPSMQRVPRMPGPPKLGEIDLTFALSLVSEVLPDVSTPTMVDTLGGDALLESPFASRRGASGSRRDGDAAIDSMTFIAADVDRTVRAPGENPKPSYPRPLLSRGIEGSFSVYFVVDTTGRIDTTTIQIPPSVQPLFAQAVREVLVQWHFVPAEIRGHRVRQLVEQTFVFKIVSGQLAVMVDGPRASPEPMARSGISLQ